MGKYKNRVGEIVGNLTLVDRVGKEYICECSVCKEDSELFGDGRFKIQYGNFAKGIIPCGCARAPRWTEEQQYIRAERKLKALPNLELVKLDYSEAKNESKILLKCKIHNIMVDTVSIHTFFGKRYKGMCLSCEKEFISEMKTESIEDINLTNYPAGSYVWRSPEKRQPDELPQAGYFKYLHCGICSEDMFVAEGLCDGIFRMTNKKSKPCRCSDKFKYTDGMLKFLVEKYLWENDFSTIRFVGLKYRESERDIILSCDLHGLYKKIYNSKNLTPKLIGCPDCSEKGGYKTHKKGYFYVLEVTHHEQGGFIGFGISNYPEDRLKIHKNLLSKLGYTIKNMYLFIGSGKSILQLESEVKREFEITSQGVAGFIKEALDTTQLNKLLDHINKYVDKIKKIDYNSFID